MENKLYPGAAYPLGAIWDGNGTNFALFANFAAGVELCCQVIQIRYAHSVFSRSRWFKGQLIPGSDLKDIAWFLPEGDQMTEEPWANGFAKSMAIFFNGSGLRMLDAKGEQIIDDNFYIIFNAYHEKLDYRLPGKKFGPKWVKIIDTSQTLCESSPCEPESLVPVNGRCIVLLQCVKKIP